MQMPYEGYFLNVMYPFQGHRIIDRIFCNISTVAQVSYFIEKPFHRDNLSLYLVLAHDCEKIQRLCFVLAGVATALFF